MAKTKTNKWTESAPYVFYLETSRYTCHLVDGCRVWLLTHATPPSGWQNLALHSSPLRETSLFLNWIYWGGIGLQKHINFKRTNQQNIICPLYHVPIASSKVSFMPTFSSFTHLYLPLLPFPYEYQHTVVCVSICYTCVSFLLNSFTFFHPALNPHPPWQLSVYSMYPCFYFVCQFILFIIFRETSLTLVSK